MTKNNVTGLNRNWMLLAMIASLGVPLAGCTTPNQGPAAPPKPSMDMATHAQEVVPESSSVPVAIQLLERGEETQAKTVLKDILAKTPGSAAARRLLSQIEAKPTALLGSTFERYRVRPGDTLSLLAKRFAGDPLLFYALARHNGIKVPTELAADSLIEVPTSSRRAPTSSSANMQQTPANEPRAAPSDIYLPERIADAATLRRAGLDEMNAGRIERAVLYFSRAQKLAPGDAAIAADLERAKRVLQTVRTAGN